MYVCMYVCMFVCMYVSWSSFTFSIVIIALLASLCILMPHLFCTRLEFLPAYLSSLVLLSWVCMESISAVLSASLVAKASFSLLLLRCRWYCSFHDHSALVLYPCCYSALWKHMCMLLLHVSNALYDSFYACALCLCFSFSFGTNSGVNYST